MESLYKAQHFHSSPSNHYHKAQEILNQRDHFYKTLTNKYKNVLCIIYLMQETDCSNSKFKVLSLV